MNSQKEPFIPKALAILAFGHMVTDLSQGALPILLPFLKMKFDLSYAQIGILVLTQNLTSSVIQPLFGYITDKITLPWLLPASILLSGLGMSIMGLAPSFSALLFIVIIGGLGVAGFHPQASRSANVVSSTASKGRSMGIFSVGGNLGMAVGSIFMTFLLSLPGLTTNTIYFVIPAAGTALLFWIYLDKLAPKDPPRLAASTQTSGPPLSYSLVALLVVFIFVRSTIHTGLTTYIPLYYINYLSGSTAFASYLLAIFLLAGVAGTYIGGSLSDRFGRKTVIVVSMLVSLPLIAIFPFTSGWITLVLIAVIGFVLISSFATTVVLAQEMMPGHVGMASGLTIGFSIGLGGVGATILGYVADIFGIPSIFVILSILPLAGAGLAMLLPGKLIWQKNSRSIL